MRLVLAFTIAATSLLAACDGSGGSKAEAEQGCRDVSDGVGDLCARCDPTNPNAYKQCYDRTLQAVNGDCKNVVSLRDKDELYSQCMPWLRTVACSQITTGFMLDSSCNGQLLYQ